MATDDFFRARLDLMIDLRHPLAVLASRMPWPQIEGSLAPVFAHLDRAGRLSEGADMFGPTLAVAGAGISNAGRPRLPIRLMVALLYLKHAYNESDESLVERWALGAGRVLPVLQRPGLLRAAPALRPSPDQPLPARAGRGRRGTAAEDHH